MIRQVLAEMPLGAASGPEALQVVEVDSGRWANTARLLPTARSVPGASLTPTGTLTTRGGAFRRAGERKGRRASASYEEAGKPGRAVVRTWRWRRCEEPSYRHRTACMPLAVGMLGPREAIIPRAQIT